MFQEFLIAKGAALSAALGKARSFLSERLRGYVGRPLDDATLAQIEELLLNADFGVKLSREIIESLKRSSHLKGENVRSLLREIIWEIAARDSFAPLNMARVRPWTAMLVGINGNGKTTTSAKLAHFCQRCELDPLLIAADTFRAAGAEQLQEWGRRLEIPCFSGKTGSDPSALIFDGLQRANSYGACIIDTAGRLHTRSDLMRELQKMRRVCTRVMGTSPIETLLVVEAPSGQNALQQAKVFAENLPITGIALTKLDGSSKGGIALALQRECQLPIRFLGIGESVGDLRAFDLRAFVETLIEP